MSFHWVRSHVKINKSLTLPIRCHCSQGSYSDIPSCDLSDLIKQVITVCLSCYNRIIWVVGKFSIMHAFSWHLIQYMADWYFIQDAFPPHGQCSRDELWSHRNPDQDKSASKSEWVSQHLLQYTMCQTLIWLSEDICCLSDEPGKCSK